MPTGLRLRAAKPMDAAGFKVCAEAAYRPYVAVIGQAPGPLLDDYRALLEAHRAWLVEDERARVVGLLILIEKGTHLLLDNVAVHPDYQGRGIGKQLMKLAEAEAKRLGYAELQLYTHEKMAENQSLYASLGYEIFDRRLERGLKRVYMRKRLD